MATGVVKMFNGDRGYAFIKPDDGGRDVFLHASALEQAGIGSLPIGSRLSFDVGWINAKAKPTRRTSSCFDWWGPAQSLVPRANHAGI
jgi:CspA family cold shock protein